MVLLEIRKDKSRISFVNQNNEESEAMEYEFSTLDSARSFFDDLMVRSSWNGFQVIYKSPSVVTEWFMFLLGNKPVDAEGRYDSDE